MEISSTKPVNASYPTGANDIKSETNNDVSQNAKEKVVIQLNEELSKAEDIIDIGQVNSSVERMNKAMTALNTTLHFAIHEETNRLMVQLVDSKENKVIKEYPSREFLDLIAKIKNMIGIFLDTKV